MTTSWNAGSVNTASRSVVSTSTWLSRATLLPRVPLRLTIPRRKNRSLRFRICGTSIEVPKAPAPTSASFRLVGGIVPAGAVRRAHQQIDLLAVELRPIHGEADVADDDHGTLGARDLHREVDDAVRLRRGGDDRAIGARAAGQVANE